MNAKKSNIRRWLAVATVFALLRPMLSAATQPSVEEPWSISSRDPVIIPPSEKKPATAVPVFNLGASLPCDFSYAWLRFYQKHLSSTLATRCPMLPSCSRFSLQAINTHGFITGIIMTADRLLHEMDEKRSAVQIRTGNQLMYADPLENNDFWWNKK